MAFWDIFQKWDLDEQEVFDRALENTMRLQPPILYVIASMLGGRPQMQEVPFVDDESVSFDLDAQYGPTLTTQQPANGAIAAFYPGVLDRLYWMVGGDVYVVFTSIHDVHVHPIGGKHKMSCMRGGQGKGPEGHHGQRI